MKVSENTYTCLRAVVFLFLRSVSTIIWGLTSPLSWISDRITMPFWSIWLDLRSALPAPLSGDLFSALYSKLERFNRCLFPFQNIYNLKTEHIILKNIFQITQNHFPLLGLFTFTVFSQTSDSQARGVSNPHIIKPVFEDRQIESNSSSKSRGPPGNLQSERETSGVGVEKKAGQRAYAAWETIREA